MLIMYLTILSMFKFLVPNRINQLICVFVCSISFSPLLLAEDLDIDFEHFTSTKGLSHDNITFIKQDNDGLLWFGSQDGLNMYDGYDITVFKPKPGSGINISFIWGMEIDSNNVIWIGTRGNGFALFDIKSKEFKMLEYNAPFDISNKIVSDFEFHDSLVWIGIGMQGLITYNRNTREIYRDTTCNLNTQVACFKYHNNTLWLGTRGRGLQKFNLTTKKTQHFKLPGNLKNRSNGMIWDINVNDDNELMIGFWERAFVAYDLNSDLDNPKMKIAIRKDGFDNLRIKSVAKAQGSYWAATRLGLHKIDFYKDSVQIEIFRPEHSNPKSINNLAAQSLFVDKSSNLWIGTREGGVNKIDFNKNKFKFYDADFFTKEISPFITFIHPVGKNAFISGPVMKKFNVKTGKVINIKQIHNRRAPDRALSVLETEIQNHKFLIIGTWLDGLYIYDLKKPPLNTKSVVHANTRDAGLYIVDIEKDSNDNIWVGTEQGLRVFTFDTLSDKKLTQDDVTAINPKFKTKFFSGSNVRSVKCDHEGNLWVGSLKGLVCIKSYNLNGVTNDFEIYSPDSTGKNHLKATGVECIFFDRQKNMWLGTVGGGLAKYNKEDESFTYFTSEQGLQADNIIEIIETDNNILWLSTNRGISSFDPNAPATQQFKNFTVADGLQGAMFNNNAAYKAPNGEIFFGGPNGLNSFFPNRLLQDTVPPNIILTKLTVFNRDYEQGEYEVHAAKLDTNIGVPLLRLNYRDYAFKVDFSALSFSNPGKNQYSYKLEGYDNDWRSVSAEQRFAEYSNLKPDLYNFLLKASNSDGYWTNEQLKLKVEIIPPLWQRLWFQLAVILTVIALAIGFYRYRISILKQRQAILEKKVDERTSELQQANVDLQERQEEIITQNEEIQQQAEELQAQKDSLAEQNEEILTKNEQISKAFKNSELLSELGKQITSELNVLSIFDIISDYVSSIVHATSFGIGLYDEAIETIFFDAFKSNGKKVEPFTRSMKQHNSFSVWCILNQKPVFINDMVNEYDNYISEKPELGGEKAIHSCIILPLTAKARKIGVMVLDSTKRHAYSEADFNNFQSLASYISIALENASAYDTIHSINKNTEKSINYARTIQSAFLPQPDYVKSYIDSFILFKPKDIVSGDFYWFLPIEQDTNKPADLIIAAMDCTGHGVPGALMSLVGNSLMRETIKNNKIYEPAEILTLLNQGIKSALKQETTGNNDGMDAALAHIQQQEDGLFKITFAGAKNPMIVLHKNGEMQSIKGSRASIGGARLRREKVFEQQELTLQTGDQIYLFSDGYADQNGPSREKFGRENMLKLLQQNASLALSEQQQKLEDALVEHIQNAEQRDDITVIGIKL